MKCKTCQLDLRTTLFRPSTCSRCQSINTFSLLEYSRRFKKQIIVGGLTLLLTVSVVGGTFVYQDARANDFLVVAKSEMGQGEFDKAESSLAKASELLSFGSTKQQIQQTKSQNILWKKDAKELKNATELSSIGKFEEAAVALGKIDKKFPLYKNVISLQKKILIQKGELAKKEAEKAKQNKPFASGGPAKPRSAAAVRGKRFTSTAAAANVASATTITQAEQAMQAFASQYGLTVHLTQVSPSGYSKTYNTFSILSDADLPALKSYGAIFIDEWSKYPTDWVASSGLKSINIIKNFVSSGTRRAAGPDPIGDAMYYDIGYGSADYARAVVHHEFDHLITYNYQGSYAPDDPMWRNYNPPGFNYGNGGASCYQPNDTCLSGEHPVAGFVTGYAASAIEEDKAELYAYLMTSNNYRRLQGWLTSDAYLVKKVNYYKAFISSRSPSMSDSYFSDINP